MNFRIPLLALSLSGLSLPALAEPPAIKAGDTLPTVLESYQGKRVAVRLQSGDELTGKVRAVTKDVLHLGELTGREFFDAVIDLHKVSAVVVRTRE
jgi:hypothetical protein